MVPYQKVVLKCLLGKKLMPDFLPHDGNFTIAANGKSPGMKVKNMIQNNNSLNYGQNIEKLLISPW